MIVVGTQGCCKISLVNTNDPREAFVSISGPAEREKSDGERHWKTVCLSNKWQRYHRRRRWALLQIATSTRKIHKFKWRTGKRERQRLVEISISNRINGVNGIFCMSHHFQFTFESTTNPFSIFITAICKKRHSTSVYMIHTCQKWHSFSFLPKVVVRRPVTQLHV